MEGSDTDVVSNPDERLGLGFQSSPSSPPPNPVPDSTPCSLDPPIEQALNEEFRRSDLKERGEDEKHEGNEENGKDEGWDDRVGSEKKGESEDEYGSENIEEESSWNEDKERKFQYPLRPDAEDCSFYMRTGTCKFGSNCRFNHPVRRKDQNAKEKVKGKDEFPEQTAPIECKYYLRSGGCKFGKACRYNHSRGKVSIPSVQEYNFLGLPIRPGERECPYYMRTGSCKYATQCRFNHPDPTAGSDSPSGYGNGGSLSLQGASQQAVASWSSSRSLTESATYVPILFPPTPGIPSQGPEWNGYQAPAYLPERSMHPPTTFVLNNPATETNIYTHHQQQMLVEEFPERPGQPECSYFLKTGDCKYRSNCKFHHPKNRMSNSPPCVVTDKGLPLRPDQNICTHYRRYGICKFGPNCKFDHPVDIGHPVSSAVSGPEQMMDGARLGGSANGSDAVIDGWN